MKRVLKIILWLVIVLAAAFCFLIIYATVSDYKPDTETLVFSSDKPDVLPDSIDFNLLIWNVGYCGLGKDMDFFYDGGKMTRTSKENVIKNIRGVKQFLLSNDSIDYYLLQEVDRHSKRSYKTDQFDTLQNALTGFYAQFGKNYDVWHVPLPFSNPLGIVESGLATFSKYQPENSIRYSFPGNYAWPKGLFMLDRCFLVDRFPLENGKELVLINTHNSAYDDGTLKKKQMLYLSTFLLNEYQKGNYIIVGGDWNQSPGELEVNYEYKFDTISHSRINKDYPAPGWNWMFYNNVPSNRRLKWPFDPATSLTTVIDFYLISPNIEKISVKTIDLHFENSDHQPVLAKIRLK